ncbi:MAG: S8 family serine peptidase [Gammaproteobacteria bacterium]|nr:S8 family serine peptidase [Gammaproteobacteria bacterium]
MAADAPGPVVAIIDTGLAWGHQDLNPGDLWINPGEVPDNGADDDGNGYVDDVLGWNFVDANNLPWDSDGHGTMVAGIVAATPGNGYGIDGLAGGARIMPLRVLDHLGKGAAFDASEAIVYAARNGADVINLSLGGGNPTRAETLAVEFADAMGVVVVAAAGNEGVDYWTIGRAIAPFVLSVGALGRDGERLASSNWGVRLDLMAPGEDVISLRSPATDLMVKFDPDAADDHVAGADRAYYRATGTSFAAPMVAGAAALVVARHPELAPHQVRRVLLASARDLGTPGRDARTGEGMLDVTAALIQEPDVWAEAEIDRVAVVSTTEGPGLRVYGSARAGTLVAAELLLGRGEAPERWTRVARLDSEVLSGELAVVPAAAFSGAVRWTLRLVVSGAGGGRREARYLVNLE